VLESINSILIIIYFLGLTFLWLLSFYVTANDDLFDMDSSDIQLISVLSWLWPFTLSIILLHLAYKKLINTIKGETK